MQDYPEHPKEESKMDAFGAKAGAQHSEAVFGGGCFWCTESVFKALKGVIGVEPGYTGGHVDNPSYEQVCNKDTGHIEVVRIVYDPSLISFKSLLEVFFATHDPTTPNRQGNDVGPQYASAIFWQTDEQREEADEVMHQVSQSLGKPLATQLRAAAHFWPAEDYHRDYYAQNPNQGYCQFVIEPKLAKFRKKFTDLLA